MTIQIGIRTSLLSLPASIDVGGETLPRHSLAGGIFKDFSTKDFNSLTSYKGGEKLAFHFCRG